jgi:hypothetical protein
MTFGPGFNVTKLFSLSLIQQRNKLKLLLFWLRANPCSGAHFRCSAQVIKSFVTLTPERAFRVEFRSLSMLKTSQNLILAKLVYKS